ncbi:MAG: hypothetical protein HYS09_02785 [Chloroflexi bacterium]|nr:hypothetical protein [Chloroflexota bacterium]
MAAHVALTVLRFGIDALSLAANAVALKEPADEGPDILPMALITAGAIVGAAVLGLLLYLMRQAIGYNPHPAPAPPQEPDQHSPSEPRH